jgi:hypothetical protein
MPCRGPVLCSPADDDLPSPEMWLADCPGRAAEIDHAVDSSHLNARAMRQPFHARPTITLPSALVPYEELSRSSQGTALGAIEPSNRHSAARCQMPACLTFLASMPFPTIVRPSRLDAIATSPPM